VVITGIVAALLVVVLARHVIVRVLLEAAISTATGYEVRFGDQKIGTRHSAFFDVHVVKNGDPVLDASRVDVEYALRDIFPGGEHRFGFAAISIQKPVLTITRHADGSLTFSRPGGTSAGPPTATKVAAAPYFFTARVRDGVIRMVDAAPLQPDLAYQTIIGVSIDASVKSDARTTAQMSGVLVARRAPGAPVRNYPLSVRSLIDASRGYALTRLRAHELPLRGALGFVVHSKAVRFDDGVIDDVAVSYYALAKPQAVFTYRSGGSFRLVNARITVPALARSLRTLQGTFILTDGALSTNALTGSIAGVPVHGKGSLYDLFGTPRFRIALATDGDLAALRSLFAFSARQPIVGSAHFETMLSAQLAQPLIRTWFSSPRLAYGAFPIDRVDGVADYYNSALLIRGISAHYGNADLAVGGSADFHDRGSDMTFVLNAHGPGAGLPYTDVIAPDATIDGTALFQQPIGYGFGVRGTLAATGRTSGAGTFAVDRYGVGEFGPFSFSRADGESLAGAFELARPFSGSAGWVHLRGFRLADVQREATLPGAVIPPLPPISGVVDGDLAGGGTPSTFGLAGTIRGRELKVATYPFGTGSVSLGGSMSDVRLSDIRVDGPMGRFSGAGAYGSGVFAIQGRYDGTLAELRPFIAEPTAVGAVHGPFSATIAGSRILVQTTGVDVAGGQVRGVAVERMAGTVAVDGKVVRIVAADGSIGGGRAVAADVGGPFLVSAPDVPVSALRHAGIPLQGGHVGMFGVADLRAGGPRFDGIVSLDDGLASGIPISGATGVSLAQTTATVSNGVAALGTTYGAFSGRIDGVGRTLGYDVNADVPIGDVDQVWKSLHLPLRTLYGSFAAQMHVRGSGARPLIDGNVALPEGSYNGLAFHDARAAVTISSSALSARDGAVTVGSTRAVVAGDLSIAQRAFALNVRSGNANLADFDDYFDEAETLAGTGPVALAFANDGRATRSSGRVDLSGFRYRRFAFGTTDATWSQRNGVVTGALNVNGARGALRANGTIAPAHGDAVAALRSARYNLSLQAQRVDLNSWLPAFGFTAPILGLVDARGTLVGRFPRLAIAGDATLQQGSLYGYAVSEGALHARSNGARISLTSSVIDLGFARFTLDGSLGLDRSNPLALAVHATAPDLAKLLVALSPKTPRYDVGGAVQADARITGTIAKPRVTAGFDVTQGRYASLAIPRVLGSVTYDGVTLEVNDAEATFAKGNVIVAGSLPLRLQPFGVNPAAPFSFTLALSQLDLAPFSAFVPGPQTKLGGTLDGRLSIEGTTQAPRVAGNIALLGGTYVSNLDRAGITHADARLTFQGTSVALEALHANVGGGTLDGSGQLDLPFPGAHTSGYTIALIAHGARIDNPQYGRGTIDGTMKLTAGPTMPILSGDATLSNASIPFTAIYRAGSGGGAGGALPFDLAFDVRATAGRKVRVQSSILDIGAVGTLDITGTLSSPKLAGVLTATPGGVFSTYNRAFRVQQATVRFDPAQGVVPYVDLRAYAHVTNPDPNASYNVGGSADITVTVQGPADELAQGRGIVFSSSPAYSQEQIVGLLLDASLFGAVNFAQQSNGTTLRGAPGESNVLLPPGVTPYQTGVISFNQEAFSILNAQFTQRFLAPIERPLIDTLGLTDLEVTVDYSGGVGYNVLKQIGHRDIYASFGQTLSFPVRTLVGFTARPNATTSINFSYFQQKFPPAIAITGPFNTIERVNGIQPLTGQTGFTFNIVRKYP
jgi:TamB, inner membrane protein subunit of TAM complex